MGNGEHWDLMLEHGDALLTWQLAHEPVTPTSLPIPGRRIGDHRRAYLDYEGPVSGDRGRVRRVDAGLVTLEAVEATRCVFCLEGGRLKGRFALIERDDAWEFVAWDAPDVK